MKLVNFFSLILLYAQIMPDLWLFRKQTVAILYLAVKLILN
jgi:hypothetical protein